MDIRVKSRVKFTLPPIVVRYESVPLLSDNKRVSKELPENCVQIHNLFPPIHVMVFNGFT